MSWRRSVPTVGSMRHNRIALSSTAVGLAIAVLIGAADASAASISRSGSTITYRAAPGEQSRLKLRVGSDGRLQFQEWYDPVSGQPSNVQMTPGEGCQEEPANDFKLATCDTNGATLIVLQLGDLKDELTTQTDSREFELPGMKLKVDGGSGDDYLFGTRGADVLAGAAGNDTIYGSGGRDVMSGSAGRDHLTGFGRLDGGAGDDSMTLAYVTPYPVFASSAFGGPGNDVFYSANGVTDRIDCGAGKLDTIFNTDRRHREKAKRNCERHVP